MVARCHRNTLDRCRCGRRITPHRQRLTHHVVTAIVVEILVPAVHRDRPDSTVKHLEFVVCAGSARQRKHQRSARGGVVGRRSQLDRVRVAVDRDHVIRRLVGQPADHSAIIGVVEQSVSGLGPMGRGKCHGVGTRTDGRRRVDAELAARVDKRHRKFSVDHVADRSSPQAGHRRTTGYERLDRLGHHRHGCGRTHRPRPGRRNTPGDHVQFQVRRRLHHDVALGHQGLPRSGRTADSTLVAERRAADHSLRGNVQHVDARTACDTGGAADPDRSRDAPEVLITLRRHDDVASSIHRCRRIEGQHRLVDHRHVDSRTKSSHPQPHRQAAADPQQC